jgi:hypothetical protein
MGIEWLQLCLHGEKMVDIDEKLLRLEEEEAELIRIGEEGGYEEEPEEEEEYGADENGSNSSMFPNPDFPF